MVHNAPVEQEASAFLPVLGVLKCGLIRRISHLFILPPRAPGNGNCCLYMHARAF